MTTGLEHTTAAILAGGLGTRLQKVVSDRPKVLAEVNGRPFLAYLLDRLAEVSLKRVVLCTGYMAELVQYIFGSSYREMELLYSREEMPLGTGGALRLALPFMTSDPILVMNGDSFCDADLALFDSKHYTAMAKASLVLTQVPDVSRYGAVEANESGLVTSFIEKGARQGSGLINAGIYLLKREIIASIPEGRNVSLEQDVFPKLIGTDLYGFLQGSRFIDIGVPDDYLAARHFLAEKPQ